MSVPHKICGTTIDGPKHGASGIVRWRRVCQARPMRDRAELVGFEQGRCFQHQPAEVRNAVYAQRLAERESRWAR